ncbi:WD repeat-containing protein 91 [Parasteatoda tepidariorum]|uniref:WD repeat-containing protein 91 n=1 Tax=Parasteatoda tepidariorum TaxID=114398 RepID=UPI00077F91AA|nr:WD repeat-containing protein 91 [Parasteatoda tepidariorum]
MSAIGFGDELVKDYLMFRGFLSTLKAFESEIKSDKDKQFRPDRIVEHLSSCIANSDLATLRDAWGHLDQRFFARLEHSFLGTAKKLEVALLRMYLVTCISTGKQDKLLEFFEKMTSELQGQPEWKEWFALPFMKNADEHPNFSVYFSRQWQDTMLLSLHNFISVVFQSAAMPTLLSYEEDLIKLQQLSDENEKLKRKLAALQSGQNVDEPKSYQEPPRTIFRNPSELMDDFYVIAQETPSESSNRSIKSLIRNISGGGTPTSPNLGRRSTESKKSEEVSSSSKVSKLKPRSPSVPPRPTGTLSVLETKPKRESPEASRSISNDEKRSSQAKAERPHLKSHHSTTSVPSPIKSLDNKSGLIILSLEKYSEHNSLITHCKFNCTGTTVASSDMDGVIKIWNATPSISTLSTIMSKTSVLSLEWDKKRERLLLYGGTTGTLRIYDSKERRVMKELFVDGSGENDQKVLCICCNPLGNNFVTSATLQEGGQLSLWDMKSLTLERYLLPPSHNACVYCCSFNHNGQLLLVGLSNGTSSILDLRTSENIATWTSHSGGVLSTEFSSDETLCYTMGEDGKFSSWNVNQTGHKSSELQIHSESIPTRSHELRSFGKLFSFSNDGNHVLTCGPLGGVIYKVTPSSATSVLDIGGHNKPVNTVDWSTAMEISTCICGTIDGKVIVSTLLNQ